MAEVDNVITFPACEVLGLTLSPAPRLTDRDIVRLETVRDGVRSAMLKGRCDVDTACAFIAADQSSALVTRLAALMSLLRDHATHRVVFYPPGTEDYDDSEVWLARVFRALYDRESSQCKALVAWRIRPIGRRRALFLLWSVLDALDNAETETGLRRRQIAL